MAQVAAVLASIPANAVEILDIMAANGCNIRQAATRIGLSHGAGRSRIQTAIRHVGRDALVTAYPMLRPHFYGNADKNDTVKVTDAGRRAHKVLTDARGLLPNKLLDVVEERALKGAPDPDPVEPGDLLPAIQQKLGLVLSYIDTFNVGTAKLAELNSTLKTLFDISQVLQGKPTSISHSANIRALKDLVPALVREAGRRGITIDGGTVERVDKKLPKKKSKENKELFSQPTKRQGLGPGHEAHPPGGSEPGTIRPRAQSEFSKILDSFSE